MKIVALAALLVPLIACDREPAPRDRTRDPQRERRVIEPPVGNVRPLPPHAIRADGVGPYRIGERLSVLLEQLPSGPRIAVFEIPGLLHRSLIRAEDNTVLIGGEPASSATFVAVVGPEVARTESGIHVGSTRGEVVAALGPITDEVDSAHDQRIIVPSALRNARIILHEDRVAAIVVSADSGTPARSTPPARETTPPTCTRPAATDKGFGACLTGAGELVEVVDNEVTVRSVETGRTTAAFRVPYQVAFVRPLRAPDGRDELIVITRADEPQVRRWSLISYRFDAAGKLAKTEPTLLYQVTSSNARWIGADLDEVELYLELSSHADSVEVGGLLTTRPAQGPWRDVVVISPVTVPRRSGKSAPPEGVDAGTTDTLAEPADAHGGADATKP